MGNHDSRDGLRRSKVAGTQRNSPATLLLGITWLLAAGPTRAEQTIQITAKKVDAAPKIDGNAGDACWKAAAATSVKLLGVGDLRDKSTPCVLKIVHDGQSFYMLVIWDDSSKDDVHKDWTWNEDKKMYLESPKIEDMFSVAWELKGPFTGNMLSPVESTWDVWQWGSARTDPAGFAKDLTHVFSFKPLAKTIKPQSTARTRDGREIWIGRPEDLGTPVYQESKLDAAKRRQKTQVVLKQFQPGKPAGSAADVAAKGSWANGKWTLEMSRKLATGAKDDTQLTTGKAFKMALSSFDRTEKGTHYACDPPILVTFAP